MKKLLAFLLVITVSFCPVLDVRADDNSDMMRSSAGENIKMEYDYARKLSQYYLLMRDKWKKIPGGPVIIAKLLRNMYLTL